MTIEAIVSLVQDLVRSGFVSHDNFDAVYEKVSQHWSKDENSIGGWTTNDVITAIAEQLGVEVDKIEVPEEDAVTVLKYMSGKIDMNYGIDWDDIRYGIEIELCNDPNNPLGVRNFKYLEKYLKEPKKN